MYKYLYVDDEFVDESSGGGGVSPISLAGGLSNENIHVEYKHVSEFVAKDYIKQHLSDYDGLLLDLRLDEFTDNEGNGSDFTATELAQHVRTLATKNELKKDIPIVLFSTDDKVRQVYATDLSSHNLFDRYIEKHQAPANASEKLWALAKGYQDIGENKIIFAAESNNDLFGMLMGLDELTDLDERVYSRFYEDTLVTPNHEYAQVILKDLIYTNGPLINEDILASRLGVDKKASVDDWRKIKELFKPAIYQGVFSDGWERWWSFKVDELFRNWSSSYLRQLSAEERVKALMSLCDETSLTAAEPIEHNSSSYFDTVCKALKQPLDSMEGFRVHSSKEPKAWQEYEYVSLKAVLERIPIDKKDIKILRSDREMLELAIEEVVNG